MVDILESEALEAMRKISEAIGVDEVPEKEPGWVTADELEAFWGVTTSTAFRRANRGVREGTLECRWVRIGNFKRKVWRAVQKDGIAKKA